MRKMKGVGWGLVIGGLILVGRAGANTGESGLLLPIAAMVFGAVLILWSKPRN
jgi:hypothetical protein